MNNLKQWAADWCVPDAALADLARRLSYVPADVTATGSESGAQSRVRLEAARRGIHAFRNNVGVLVNEAGIPIRFGLANDSKQLNERLKSADLIGIKPNGQFWSREVKHPGWKYTGTGREVAQLAWIKLINACGGDAGFATCEDDV